MNDGNTRVRDDGMGGKRAGEDGKMTELVGARKKVTAKDGCGCGEGVDGIEVSDIWRGIKSLVDDVLVAFRAASSARESRDSCRRAFGTSV